MYADSANGSPGAEQGCEGQFLCGQKRRACEERVEWGDRYKFVVSISVSRRAYVCLCVCIYARVHVYVVGTLYFTAFGLTLPITHSLTRYLLMSLYLFVDDEKGRKSGSSIVFGPE